MTMQIYLITIAYLLIGAGQLLVDYYGGRLLLLIRLRNMFRTSVKIQVLSIVGGIGLVLLKVFFPVAPGPALLGDLFPAGMMFILVIYYLSQLMVYHKKGRDAVEEDNKRLEEDMLQKTGSYIETNKRNLGVVMVVCATLHFLFPQAVLL
jgi:hypothetical protein